MENGKIGGQKSETPEMIDTLYETVGNLNNYNSSLVVTFR